MGGSLRKSTAGQEAAEPLDRLGHLGRQMIGVWAPLGYAVQLIVPWAQGEGWQWITPGAVGCVIVLVPAGVFLRSLDRWRRDTTQTA